MKLSEYLKNSGVSLDSDFDDASLAALGSIVGVNKDKDNNKDKNGNTININVSSGDSKDADNKLHIPKDAIDDLLNKKGNNDNDEGKDVEDQEMDYKTIKFDETTGLFDLSNIENEDLKAVLGKANDTVVATSNRVKIDAAFNSKMSSVKIRKGITADAIRSLIKMDNVKVDKDGKVVGLDEAFDTLQKEQSGLFVQRDAKESSPILEGYNPSSEGSVGGSNTSGGISDSELMALSSALKGE